MKNSKPSRRKEAFTMVETIVSLTLSAVILASVTSTFMAFAQGSKSIAAYTGMSEQSRKALELFSRDIRSAVDVTSANGSDVVVTLPDNAFHNGQSVRYVYDDLVGIFSRVERQSDGTVVSNDVLLDGVEQFVFSFYDPLGGELAHDSPSLLLSLKSIRIDSELSRRVSGTEANDYIISARFMMRNRPVTR